MIARIEDVDRVREADADAEFAAAVEDIVLRIGGAIVISECSMHVPRGSIYGLVGPNGAGKTSMLRVLAGLERLDAGTAMVDGIDVRLEPARVQERIGYMPDRFGVYESLTAREYLDFYAASYRIRAPARRPLVEETLELVNLSDSHDVPVSKLSRGMKQRLGIGRCLIHDPSLLLLDEPGSGLDPQSRLELRQILEELQRLGKTILISSHILPELNEMCTSAGFMEGGRIVAEGPLDELEDSFSGSVRLRLQVLDTAGREAAIRVLEMHPQCIDVQPHGETAVVALYTGSDEDLATLLRDLLNDGVPVLECSRTSATLQDIFLNPLAWSEVEA